MTETATLAREERASDLVPARLAPNVRAAVDGDWVIFLDLGRNRYRAVSLAAAPPIEGVPRSPGAGRPSPALRQALEREGLLVASPCADRDALFSQASVSTRQALIKDLWLAARAALWARRIVRQGALPEAFIWLVRAKRNRALEVSLERASAVHARFAAARIWIPAPYVCLFDSLCLMRFLLAHGLGADLVFGVRARPFAAHCWVECEGAVLDDGGEACASFAEIARA